MHAYNVSRDIGNSLFDRLIDTSPQSPYERIVANSYDEQGYRSSALQDIQRLFNTRSGLTAEQYETDSLNVRDYGIPDFTHFAPGNGEDQQLLVRLMLKALHVFERRLFDIEIEVATHPVRPRALRLHIEGWLKYNSESIRLAFVTQQDDMSYQWIVHERS